MDDDYLSLNNCNYQSKSSKEGKDRIKVLSKQFLLISKIILPKKSFQTYMDVELEDDVPIIQSILTGGGAGALTVAMETSPMIRRASLHAWY